MKAAKDAKKKGGAAKKDAKEEAVATPDQKLANEASKESIDAPEEEIHYDVSRPDGYE